MTDKAQTKATVRAILRRLVANAIPVTFKANSPVPGAGERKSLARGSGGYDVVARVEYEPGDDPRDIDWPATAQTGGQIVLTTQYAEPRDIKVFVLVDVNPTMDFGTFRVTKRELAAELAGSVIKSAEETRDKVGFMAYSDRTVEVTLPPRSAQATLMPALYSLIEAKGDKPGRGSGLNTALSMLPLSRSLVFIISDFNHMTEAETKALKRASFTHEVVCLLVQDRREYELPKPEGWRRYVPQLITLRDIRTGQWKSIWNTQKNRKAFTDSFEQHKNALLALFKASHCGRAVFSTEEGDAAIPKLMRLFSGHRG